MSRASSSSVLLPAAPMDAMAYSGIQINGSMDVAQEGLTAAALTASTAKYLIDGWLAVYGHAAGTAVFVGGQTGTGGLPGLPMSVYLKANTALTSPAAGDFATIYQQIEGNRFERCGFGSATPSAVTIGFWVSSSRSGTMTVALRNAAFNRSYPINVPIAAGGFGFNVVTFPGDTQSSSWPIATNGLGASLSFCFCCGSSLAGTVNQWNSVNAIGTSSTTNFFQANNDIVYLTGVVVLPGNEAPIPSRAPLIMRPFDEEQLLCMRQLELYTYAQNGAAGPIAFGQGISGVSSLFTFPYYVPKRTASPALIVSSPGHFSMYDANVATGYACSALSISNRSKRHSQILGTAATGMKPGQCCIMYFTDPAGVLGFDDRL